MRKTELGKKINVKRLEGVKEKSLLQRLGNNSHQVFRQVLKATLVL